MYNRLLALLALVALFSFSSVEGQTTYLRVAHLISDFSTDTAVDVYVNGDKTLANFTYPTVTDYLSLPPGVYATRVNLYNTNTVVIAETNFTLADGVYYTVAAVGSISNTTAYPPSYSVAVDDLTIPDANKVRIAFFHGAAGAPAVDVKTGNTTLFSNKAYRDAQASLTVDGGDYPVSVFVAGTSTEVLNLGTVSFPAGNVVTVFAKGDVAGGQGVSVTTKSVQSTSTFTSSSASSLSSPFTSLFSL